MTTDAARKAVLHTNELLEEVILYLPMKTIFGVQRVCKQFKDVIATSPKIQTKMFLRLRNDVPDEKWALERLQKAQRPRLAHLDDARFRKVDVKTKARLSYRPVILNPLLEVVSLIEGALSANRLYNSVDRREAVTMSFSQSHFGTQPSFLKTYISDPPCYTANGAITADFLFDSAGEYAVRGTVWARDVTLEQGLTIGDVVLARTRVGLRWHVSGLGDWDIPNTQLEEVVVDAPPFVTGEGSGPHLILELSGVVVPTNEERRAVLSENVEVTS